MTVLSLVAAAPVMEVQGKAVLIELLGFCCHSCKCQSQASPRALAMLLGFYLHSHSQGWTLEVSNQCRKTALCSSGELALHCLSHLVWLSPWLGPGTLNRLNALQLKKCNSLQYSIYGTGVHLLSPLQCRL